MNDNEFKWIEEVPDYLGFENLKFEPHKLSKDLPKDMLLHYNFRNM